MKQKIIIIALIGTALLALVAPAAAQSNQTGPTIEVSETDREIEEEACETIDENTQVCSSEMDGSTAELVIFSERTQRLTFTDAGGFFEGGEIFRDTQTVREGQNKVRVPLTVVDGNAAVSIDTGTTLYGIVLRSSDGLLTEPITREDVWASALGAAASISLAVLVITYRSITGRDDQPERVA